MSEPPLSLVKVLEDPRSRREKRVVLTARGGQFIAAMADQGKAFFSPIITEMTAKDANEGLRFLRKMTALLERSLHNNRRTPRRHTA